MTTTHNGFIPYLHCHVTLYFVSRENRFHSSYFGKKRTMFLEVMTDVRLSRGSQRHRVFVAGTAGGESVSTAITQQYREAFRSDEITELP